jgi:hypothetical protein
MMLVHVGGVTPFGVEDSNIEGSETLIVAAVPRASNVRARPRPEDQTGTLMSGRAHRPSLRSTVFSMSHAP